MEAVLRLFRKELIQVFRDRKLLFSTLVLPVLLMPVFMFGPSLFLSRLLQGAAERVQEVAVAGLPEEALKALEAARLKPVPVPDPAIKRQKRVLQGDVPSPVKPPSGCHFHTRCPYAVARCKIEAPPLREIAPGHHVSCHLR